MGRRPHQHHPHPVVQLLVIILAAPLFAGVTEPGRALLAPSTGVGFLRPAHLAQAGRSARSAKGGEVSPKMLTNMIRDVSTPREVFEIMKMYGGDFNEIHYATCLRQLAVMGTQVTQKMVNSRDFDDFMYALEYHIDMMDPFGLSITAWSLGMLSKTLKINAGRVMESVATHATITINQFPEKSISNRVWGLAQLRYKDVALMEAVARRTCKICRSLKQREIGSVMWGFAEMKIYDEELMEALAQGAMKSFGQWSLQDMAALASSFTRLNQTHKELFRAMTTTLVRQSWKDESHKDWLNRAQILLASSRAGTVEADFLNRVEQQLSPKVVSTIGVYAVAAMLWACRKLGCQATHPELVSMLEDRASKWYVTWADIEHESFLDAVEWQVRLKQKRERGRC